MYSFKSLIKKDNFPSIYYFIICLSFLFGFFLNEDSAGGGLVDFEHEWTSIQEFKLGILSALTSIKYESSRTPLFLILNYFNPFSDTEYGFRLSNFIFNIFIPIPFFYLLKYKHPKISSNLLISVSLLLYLSPYFRTSSYWAHQENLPIFFTLISLLYLEVYENKIIKQNIINIFGIAIISSLAFYSDQKYIFVSFYCFVKLILLYKNDLYKLTQISFFFFISSIPTFYLFYLWKGILPIQSQFRIGFYPKNITLSLSIISFYFLPFLLIIKDKFGKLISKINKKDVFIFVVIFFISIFSLPDFNNAWGGGVIFKFFYVLNLFLKLEILTKILFITTVTILSFFSYLIIKNYFLNFLPLVIIIALSSMVEMTYQEYFDPLLIILIFVYFRFEKDLINIMNTKNVFIYSIFFIIFLIIANIYYNYFNLVT